jgi:hypothetical protein
VTATMDRCLARKSLWHGQNGPCAKISSLVSLSNVFTTHVTGQRRARVMLLLRWTAASWPSSSTPAKTRLLSHVQLGTNATHATHRSFAQSRHSEHRGKLACAQRCHCCCHCCCCSKSRCAEQNNGRPDTLLSAGSCN